MHLSDDSEVREREAARGEPHGVVKAAGTDGVAISEGGQRAAVPHKDVRAVVQHRSCTCTSKCMSRGTQENGFPCFPEFQQAKCQYGWMRCA